MPPINGIGQLYSTCAYLWAVAGATLFLPPFGLLNITGVTGDLITFQNANITQGTLIQAGTLLIQGAPQAQTSSQLVAQLDKLSGFLNNAPGFIVGSTNQLLRWNDVGGSTFLQPTNGMIFHPNPGASTEVAPEDVGGAGITTTPIVTTGTGVTAYYDLPNLPAANLLPATFYALVHLRQSCVTNETTEANGYKIQHNSVEIASMMGTLVNHGECLLPVTGNRLQLTHIKFVNRANVYGRIRILGYYF